MKKQKFKEFNIIKKGMLPVLLNALGNIFFSLCVIVALVLILFSSVTIECVVVGQSMSPTFNVDEKSGNDVVYVNKKNHDYSFGDIIVIDVGDKDPIIKRVVGMPGDIIDFVWVEKDGYKLEINGKIIEEDYIRIDYDSLIPELRNGMYIVSARFKNEMQENFPENFVDGKFVVPENSIFALGDNRHDSKDSIYYGAFKYDQILGIVEWVRYSNESEFKFYWDYVISGKFFTTISNCY